MPLPQGQFDSLRKQHDLLKDAIEIQAKAIQNEVNEITRHKGLLNSAQAKLFDLRTEFEPVAVQLKQEVNERTRLANEELARHQEEERQKALAEQQRLEAEQAQKSRETQEELVRLREENAKLKAGTDREAVVIGPEDVGELKV